ncbi:hypothetical protein AVEN_165801-1 [Araneus ventricosus]|uniref:Uncharacterized protein n=1 Tax=Araneus ventricosus TaxID=182803 RepID=A0A4Y2EPV7_ARAVE|nr:hypothetical protein AVEN_165801-1 [Araneus ventricosus]
MNAEGFTKEGRYLDVQQCVYHSTEINGFIGHVNWSASQWNSVLFNILNFVCKLAQEDCWSKKLMLDSIELGIAFMMSSFCEWAGQHVLRL